MSSVQSFSNHTFRPEEIAIRIRWANDTKALTFGHQKDSLVENNIFVVLPSSDEQMVQFVSFETIYPKIRLNGF